MTLRGALDLFLRCTLPIMVGAAVSFSGVLGPYGGLALITGLVVSGFLILRAPDHTLALFSASRAEDENDDEEDFLSRLWALRTMFEAIEKENLDLREMHITISSTIKMRIMHQDCLRAGLYEDAGKALLIYHTLVDLLSEELT